MTFAENNMGNNIATKTQCNEKEPSMGRIMVFKVMEKDATIRGGAMVQMVANATKGEGLDAALEVHSIGGEVGRKRITVTDLTSSSFEEGIGVLQQISGDGQKMDVGGKKEENNLEFVQLERE